MLNISVDMRSIPLFEKRQDMFWQRSTSDMRRGVQRDIKIGQGCLRGRLRKSKQSRAFLTYFEFAQVAQHEVNSAGTTIVRGVILRTENEQREERYIILLCLCGSLG